MSTKQKTAIATTFAIAYDKKEIDFIPFIKFHTLAKEEVELWELIKNDSNSLQKSSTLYFLFDEE